MIISGKTKVLGLLGYPVEHSLSPAMHNAAFEYLNLDYCYVTFPVRPEMLGDAVKAVRALSLRGINVTVPHKENVIPFLDRVDEEASFIGAVNTVLNSDDRLTGFNTDGRGFMESLKEANISVEGKTVFIIGAGGASRAISYYLCKKASRLFLFDIDSHKVKDLINDLSGIRKNVAHKDNPGNLKDIDITINATPLGLKDTDPYPVDITLLDPDMVVCDLIYRQTSLLKAAEARGCKTLSGLGMLLHQGALAFEIWTGIKPPIDVMRNAVSITMK
jgi:shikimate dehydrogenase